MFIVKNKTDIKQQTSSLRYSQSIRHWNFMRRAPKTAFHTTIWHFALKYSQLNAISTC